MTEETITEKYEIYHNTYSSAIQHAVSRVKSQGLEVDDYDYNIKVATGPHKPSRGKTNVFDLELTKGGKPQRKMLHMQIYNTGSKYELNMYVEETNINEDKEYSVDMQGTLGQRRKHTINARSEKEALYKVRRKEKLGKSDVFTADTSVVEPQAEPVAMAAEETKMKSFKKFSESTRRHLGGKKFVDPADINNDSDEDSTDGASNITMQLRKAVSINKPVKFKNGKSEKVDSKLAVRAQVMFQKLRTAPQKEAWMKKASASLGDLKKLVDGK